MKSRKPKILLLSLFLLLEAILYCLILFVHTDWYVHRVICFSSVLIVSAFGWIFLKRKEFFFVAASLSLTCAADFLLEIVYPMQQVLALSFFFITQFVYALYICSFSKRIENLIHLSLRALSTILAGVLAYLILKERLDFLSLLSVCYFWNLLLNIVFAFIHVKKHPLLAIGLLLFALCDFTLGLTLGIEEGYIELPKEVVDILFLPFDFVWLFYTPSQVLLCLEIYRGERKAEALD